MLTRICDSKGMRTTYASSHFRVFLKARSQVKSFVRRLPIVKSKWFAHGLKTLLKNCSEIGVFGSGLIRAAVLTCTCQTPAGGLPLSDL